MEVEHYREVVDRIRDKNSEVIINLTTGPGGRFHPTEGNPSLAGPRTNCSFRSGVCGTFWRCAPTSARSILTPWFSATRW